MTPFYDTSGHARHVSWPAWKAFAVVAGRGSLAGRYRDPPPGTPGEVQVEMYRGPDFVWVAITKAQMEDPELMKRRVIPEKGWFLPTPEDDR